MKKIKFYIDLNYVGTVRSEIIEFPDDATDEDINETYDVGDNYRITHIGTIYFKDCESCRKCIKEVVEPYWEKHKDEWDWNYEY